MTDEINFDELIGKLDSVSEQELPAAIKHILWHLLDKDVVTLEMRLKKINEKTKITLATLKERMASLRIERSRYIKSQEQKKEKDWTQEHEKQAEQLQQDPEIIPKLATALDKFIVGETNKKLLSYLNAFSTKLKRDKKTPPNHTRLVSPAAAGKTHLIGSTLEFFPKENKIILGGSSRMALKYGEPDYTDKDDIPVIDFDGKILWFLEEKGGEESYDILRPILSRDQEEITCQFVNRDETGRNILQKVKFRGCPAYFTSTTKVRALEETETRTFQLSLTLTPEQTKAIVEKKLNLKSFPNLDVCSEDELKVCQCLFRQTKPLKVWVPFAKLIKFKSYEELRLRRDVDKVVNLVEVLALIQQKQRKTIAIDGEEHIIATALDFNSALNILSSELEPTLKGLSKHILDFLEEIKANFWELDTITHKSIAKKTKYSQSTVRVYTHALVEAGYLTVELEKRENVYEFKEKPENRLYIETNDIEQHKKGHLGAYQ